MIAQEITPNLLKLHLNEVMVNGKEPQRQLFLNQCEPPPEVKEKLTPSPSQAVDRIELLEYFKTLPDIPAKKGPGYDFRKFSPFTSRTPQWNSVFLFYNLAEAVTKTGRLCRCTAAGCVESNR